MGNKEIARLSIKRTQVVRQVLAKGRLYMQERRLWNTYKNAIHILKYR